MATKITEAPELSVEDAGRALSSIAFDARA